MLIKSFEECLSKREGWGSKRPDGRVKPEKLQSQTSIVSESDTDRHGCRVKRSQTNFQTGKEKTSTAIG